VSVDANLRLREAVSRGELDLAVLFQEPGEPAPHHSHCEPIETLRRVWVASPELELMADRPLPLVLPVAPCIFRSAVLATLDAARQPWHVVLSTPSLAGIRAAVRAGLGVGVRSERWLEPELRRLDQQLPPLPDVELVLLTANNTDTLVVERLREAVRQMLTPRLKDTSK
jgi:DNA-binding transcriptional LysR family regulator